MPSAREVMAAPAASPTGLSWRREPALGAACSWRWKEAGRGPREAWLGASAWRCLEPKSKAQGGGCWIWQEGSHRGPRGALLLPRPPPTAVHSEQSCSEPATRGGSREQDVCRTSHSKGKSPFVLERTTAASRFCPGIGSAHHSGPCPAPYPVEFYSGVNIVAEALGTGGEGRHLRAVEGSGSHST